MSARHKPKWPNTIEWVSEHRLRIWLCASGLGALLGWFVGKCLV